MTRPRVWLLNLDADDELAAPARYADPFAALAGRPHLRAALGDLVRDDVVLERGARAPEGAVGRAFSPTPRARTALATAGAEVRHGPDVGVLRRVADRRFGLTLGPGHVEGAVVVDDLAQLEALCEAIPGPRVHKRIFGFAGRGRHLASGGPPSAAELGFVARALREDGAVVVEPWLERTLDAALHGFIPPRSNLGRDLVPTPAGQAESAVALGAPTVQETTRGGAWRATRVARTDDLTDGEREALEQQARRAAEALASAGYWGPFGVDAFRFEGRDGQPGLVARCEVNARYTMGWAIGMGSLRPDLEP